jgi:hypothetical protein
MKKGQVLQPPTLKEMLHNEMARFKGNAKELKQAAEFYGLSLKKPEEKMLVCFLHGYIWLMEGATRAGRFPANFLGIPIMMMTEIINNIFDTNLDYDAMTERKFNSMTPEQKEAVMASMGYRKKDIIEQ